MFNKKTDLVIVHRGFWVDDTNKVIGEALLDFSERVSVEHTVCVITQTQGHLKQRMTDAGRGCDVELLECNNHTTSSSRIFVRALDSIFFALFVFVGLLRTRPNKVYVSTVPPVMVPFVVFVYCWLFSAKYYYHIQDIHPEATNIVVPLPRPLFYFLRMVDSLVIKKAEELITLTQEMANQIDYRTQQTNKISLLDNPAGFNLTNAKIVKEMDFVFCGNAGRLQRIPLIVDAIKEYYVRGGTCEFTFIGGGKESGLLKELDAKFPKVTYLGPLPPDKASSLILKHRWALLPIDDGVTKYAFPSKTSSYLLSGCRIFAICGTHTSVAKWVLEQDNGIVCDPEINEIVEVLFEVEKDTSDIKYAKILNDLNEKYSYKQFSESLCEIILGKV